MDYEIRLSENIFHGLGGTEVRKTSKLVRDVYNFEYDIMLDDTPAVVFHHIDGAMTWVNAENVVTVSPVNRLEEAIE